MFITYSHIPDNVYHFIKRQLQMLAPILIISLFSGVALATTVQVGGWSITGLTPGVAQIIGNTKVSSDASAVTIEKSVNAAAALDGYSDAHLGAWEGKTIHSSLQTISEYNKAGYRLLEYNGLILLCFVVFFAATGALLTMSRKRHTKNRSMIFILHSARILAVAVSCALIVLGYFYVIGSINYSHCSAEVSHRIPLLLWSPMLGIVLISLIAFYTSETYRKKHDGGSNKAPNISGSVKPNRHTSPTP
ncbi:hypothetical protein JKG47_05465 [Acidithiobacillus sp. MC6.1]|uniref:hypothetical protein n=1 Tax=Acidithiobacillus ferrivorans TaxID=160808 RepID=UPI001147A668|nr:hypothetical protein [Acidithiobacillus ferrivorans]MBN6739991.1 hypothetical protein [Acidithiobacillus sp. MC6.1]